MLLTRKELEEREDRALEAYAMRSAASRGRRNSEPPHDHRTDFQRDRDRVIHSKCFRRLEYKTQVFINGTADHYRTRLTHTFEMTAVARTIARALRANEDLAECIALAHDIGHSPFGHAGEAALNELMQGHGGFDHNIQSVRAVEYLEHRYPGFPGLNLTWEVRAGLYKHQASLPGFLLDGCAIGPQQMVEAQIADLADDLTYYAHDIDDGLEAGLLKESQLEDVEIWRRAVGRAEAEFPGLPADSRTGMIVRQVLALQVDDALATSAALLARYRPQSPAEVMACPERLVTISPALLGQLQELRTFLFERMYFSDTVARASREAVDLMRKLFLHYVEHPETMGRKAQSRIPADGVWRAACDYIAGMTDRYALEEIAKFGLSK